MAKVAPRYLSSLPSQLPERAISVPDFAKWSMAFCLLAGV